MIPTFRFKEFAVSDTGCGMKLSSDAVVLGAYAKPPESGKILDIGCGCGILTLMMAQQSKHAYIDALDIDEAACRTTTLNCNNSHWKDRISVHNGSLEAFCNTSAGGYDCIISNPPYFHNQLRSSESKTSLARHASELNYDSLCSGVAQLLLPSGLFWVIVPYSERSGLLNAALGSGLFCKKTLNIYNTADSEAVRSFFCFCKEIILNVETEELVIKDGNNDYSEGYKELTKDYYL